MLNKAIDIANRIHARQVDKGGAPYILHPLRVMLAQSNEVEMICAVLHDVVEDSDITLNDLRVEGFSEDIITVLNCLSKKKGESYDNFINRILINQTACRVKLADLCDNMDISRITNPTEKDIERIKKYQDATERILDVIVLEDGSTEERIIKNKGCFSNVVEIIESIETLNNLL